MLRFQLGGLFCEIAMTTTIESAGTAIPLTEDQAAALFVLPFCRLEIERQLKNLLSQLAEKHGAPVDMLASQLIPERLDVDEQHPFHRFAAAWADRLRLPRVAVTEVDGVIYLDLPKKAVDRILEVSQGGELEPAKILFQAIRRGGVVETRSEKKGLGLRIQVSLPAPAKEAS